MKIMHGAFFFPCSNMSLTLLAPTPTNISTKSEPDIVKKGTLASPATALASNVLPVPGGPTNKTPLGIFPPNFWNFLGFFRNSIISSNSSFASSIPATSSNVTLPCFSVSNFAFDFPKPIAPPFPPCICFIKNIQTPIKSSIGSQFSSIPRIGDTLSSSGAALTFTPLAVSLLINSGSFGA